MNIAYIAAAGKTSKIPIKPVAYLNFLGAIFLVAQLAVIAAFAFTLKRKRTDKEEGSVSVSTGIVNVARTDSLCKLYEPGFGRRF